MDNFFPARGCVYSYNVNSDSGPGLYDVPGLRAVGGEDTPVLITGVDISLKESFMPVSTTENFNVIYSYGKDFGDVTVHGELLLGTAEFSTGVVSRLLRWAEDNRMSTTRKPLDISIDDEAYQIYILGFALGAPNPEFNTQPFRVFGLQVDKPL